MRIARNRVLSGNFVGPASRRDGVQTGNAAVTKSRSKITVVKLRCPLIPGPDNSIPRLNNRLQVEAGGGTRWKLIWPRSKIVRPVNILACTPVTNGSRMRIRPSPSPSSNKRTPHRQFLSWVRATPVHQIERERDNATEISRINPLATVGAYRRLEILRLWYWERL